MEKLETLEADIKIAQNKLQDLGDALNRDQAILEGGKKEIEDLQSQKSSLETSIADLEEQYASVLSDFNLFEQDISTQKQTLIQGVESMEVSLATGQEELDTVDKTITKKKSDCEAYCKKLQDDTHTTIAGSQEKIHALNGDINNLITQKEIISQEVTKVMDRKALGESEVAELAIVSSKVSHDVTMMKDELGNLEGIKTATSADIDRLQTIKVTLIDDNATLVADNNALKNMNQLLVNQNKENQSEMIDVNKQKFIVQKKQEELNNREEFIKEKYETAGVPR